MDQIIDNQRLNELLARVEISQEEMIQVVERYIYERTGKYQKINLEPKGILGALPGVRKLMIEQQLQLLAVSFQCAVDFYIQKRMPFMLIQ